MEINQNQTNLPPVGSKSSGFSALQKPDEKRKKENNVVELDEAKALSEAKQVKKQSEVKKTEAEITDLSNVVAKINEQVQSVQRDLVFSVDKESGRDIVTIKDSNSDEVIRQIPSEEMLELAKNIDEQIDSDDTAKAFSLFSSSA